MTVHDLDERRRHQPGASVVVLDEHRWPPELRAWQAWHRRTHVLLDQVASFATLGDLDQAIAALTMLREHRSARPTTLVPA